MAIDAARLQTVCDRLISESGRTVTLIKLNRGVDDSNKPWDGRAQPRATPADTQTVKAVFLDTISSRYLGKLVQIQDNISGEQQFCMISTKSMAGKNFRDFDELKESTGTLWAIKAHNILHPGLVEFFGALTLEKKELYT